MGIFSGKKKTYVSSLVYNLAGDDPEDRVDYVKYTVLNALLQERSVSESLTDSLLRGRGQNFQIAFRYARDKFEWGLPNSVSKFVQLTNNVPILDALSAEAQGQDVEVISIESGIADYTWWAEREMTEKYLYDPVEETMGAPPAGVQPNAVVSFDVDRTGTIYLEFLNPGSTVPVIVKINPPDYVMKVNYIFALYRYVSSFITKEEVVTRPFQTGDVTRGSTTVTVIETDGEERTTTLQVNTVTDGTTTTITTKETVVQKSRSKYFIYQLGKGTYPAIDALADTLIQSGSYFPAIPLRVNNEDWTDEEHQKTELYKTSKKLLGHLGLKIDEMSKIINGNRDVKNIDYGFVVQGVPINAKTQASRMYLFEFFNELMTTQSYNKPDFDTWKAGNKKLAPNINTLEIFHPDNRTNNYNIKLQWQYVSRQNFAGQVKPGARIGDMDVQVGTKQQWEITQGGFGAVRLVSGVDGTSIYFRKQISANQYAEIEVCGLVFQNFVYNGKYVELTATEVFETEDDEEPEEGLLIPLDMNALNNMNLRWRTQLSYESSFIVFNCYQIVKQKWYQTGAFKIIMAIIAIVIIILSWGTATGPVAGIWGTMYGALLYVGVNYLIAQIIVALLYYLAMMIIMKLLTAVGTKLFGETWGRVFAVIVMIIVTWGAGTGEAVSTATTQTSVTAVQILQGLTAVAQVVNAYSTGQQIEIAEDLAKLSEAYKADMKEIEDMSKEMLDTNLDLIDIQGLINTQKRFMLEGPSEFLQRTLMTGSEICELTSGLVDNFASMNLRLDLPTGA